MNAAPARRVTPGTAGSWACLFLILAAIPFTAGCIANPFYHEGVVVPQISPVMEAAYRPQPDYTFPFQGATVSLSVPVNASVYAGAKAADKGVVIYGDVSEEEWVAESYAAMMDDPSQDEFYHDLRETLRSIRKDLSLSDDEYLELITVFVQSIPYETSGKNPPKFPIETFADRSGDCDDKSLLLAALLSREDYRVALLAFREESHMAVGITCPGAGYRDTGYAYVEATNITLAGIPPDDLAGGVVISSGPVVIPVGSGTKTFGACNQTQYLYDMFTSTEDRFLALSKEADARKSEIEGLAAANNINAYNQRIAYYNSLVDRMKRNADVHNYILNHQYDRKGTYRWVRLHLAGL